MGLESVTYISDLNATNPTAADPKSQGDDHIRAVKGALKATFPNITGVVTATHTELSYMVGATIQPAMKDGSNLVTPTFGDSSTKIATTAFVAAMAFASALPGQTGQAGKVPTSDGIIARWDWSQYMNRSTRTANTALAQSDRATLIDITSGTFTQTFTAAATLGAGWYCLLRNAGTGDITLDPNGAELIDGLTSYVMYPGEARLIQCDGTGFTSVVVRPFSKTFASSGTFTKPPGYAYFEGLAWSGGASGGRSSGTGILAVGGSGGGCFPFTIPAAVMAASESVTIGAGGASVTGYSLNGNTGGSTALGTFFVVTGGASTVGGGVNGAYALPNNNAVGFEGAGNSVAGLNSIYGGSSASNNGTSISGSSVYGGAAGAGIDSSNVTYGAGTSKFGGNGGAAFTSSSGAVGTAPGGGGGATQTGPQSGAGARGELRIWGKV